MRIAVWKTGHQIADKVADAAIIGINKGGLDDDQLISVESGKAYLPGKPELLTCDTHIAYGILRGTANVFRECDRLGKPWLHLDRGYFGANHYDGYYRVSLRGTQQVTCWPEPDYERLAALGLDIKPWRGVDESKPVLVCPPTDAVAEFFKLGNWLSQTRPNYPNYVTRAKGDPTPINFDDYSHVLTFNSSVGWQALAAGIPCISDPTHSIVGSYFAKLTDNLSENHHTHIEMQYAHRERLFGIMAAQQLTLSEIRSGKLWGMIQSLLSGSGSIPESLKPAIPAPTASSAAPSLQSKYAT